MPIQTDEELMALPREPMWRSSEHDRARRAAILKEMADEPRVDASGAEYEYLDDLVKQLKLE